MSQSSASKARTEKQRNRRRENRKVREAVQGKMTLKTSYSLTLTGYGTDALVHPTLIGDPMVGVGLFPLARMSEMILGGGPSSLLPSFRQALAEPVLFFVGIRKDSPGQWAILVGGKKPLEPVALGQILSNGTDGSFGPVESLNMLETFLEKVAEMFDRTPSGLADDLLKAAVTLAVKKWEGWKLWAETNRPDLIAEGEPFFADDLFE